VLMQQKSGVENFGLTADGYFVFGALTIKQVLQLHFTELVTGFGWLVKEGEVMPGRGGEIAPRTAIGADKEGRLLMFEVDGVEDEKYGLTNYQMAEWFKALGAYNAIDLDGGGSSVTYYDGKVVSVPSCNDTPKPCERKVTTMACVIN